jgi:hypothetical protein
MQAYNVEYKLVVATPRQDAGPDLSPLPAFADEADARTCGDLACKALSSNRNVNNRGHNAQ